MVASRVTTKLGPMLALPAVSEVAVKLLMAKSEVRWMAVPTAPPAGELFAPGAPAAPSSNTDGEPISRLLVMASVESAPVDSAVVMGDVIFTTNPAPGPTAIGP